MTDKRTFILAHPLARHNAAQAIAEAPDGWRVTIEPPKRTDGQNERFHALCGDLAKSELQWAGKRRNTAEWKVLLVSGHSKATDENFELVPGIEGEYLNIRESTAIMSVRRAASLIEYATAFADMKGVKLMAPENQEERQ